MVSPKIFDLISALSRKQKSYVFLAVDLALVPFCLLFTLVLQPAPVAPLHSLRALGPVLPYVMGTMALISTRLGLPMVRLNAYERHAVARTVVAATGTAVSLTLLTQLFGPRLSLGTYVVFATSLVLFMMAARALMHQIVLVIYRRADPGCRVLIYGAGTTGTQLAQALKSHDGIDPVAFVDDNSSLQGVTLVGLQVFAPARIADLMDSRRIDRVLLAMPSQSQPKQAQVIRRLQRLGVEVQALPSFSQLVGEEALVDKLTAVAPQTFLGRKARSLPLSAASTSYADRVVLVSGAGGSIGSELCRQILLCRPARLVLFELSELALYTVHQELEEQARDNGVELVPVLGSVTDPRQVPRILQLHGVQVVLHAAAYKHVPLVEANPLPGLANNVFGTQNLAQAALQSGVERFILISSDKAVRPTNVMGASKRMAELLLQDLAQRSTTTIFTMVRFGNVLGSSGSVVPLFQDQIRRGGPITVTDPRVTRYFMTISEAVQLVLQAGAEALGGEVFVLDMGAPVSILQLARQVIESAGYSLRDAANPNGDIEIQIIGLRPGEKLEEELTLTDELITTRHAKIFCARESSLSEIEVATFMRGLRVAVAAGDETAARQMLRRWVEGYGRQDTDRKSS